MKISPWAGTLMVSALAAVLVAGAGLVLSRSVDSIAEKPAGNRVDDAYREMIRRIGKLEALWQSALEEEAARLLESGTRELEPNVVGMVQCSWLNPGFSDPSRAHRCIDGREPRIKPVLDRFAKGESSEWVFSADELIHGASWIETLGRPLAWHQGNGKVAVILLLDPAAATETAQQDISKRIELALPEDEPGALTWSNPGGKVFLTNGLSPPEGKPDEILRHVSRFGDWTLRRYYPVRVVTHYHLPILTGAFGLAGLLLVGGIAIASWQRKATRLAEQRVSFVNRVSHELRTPLTNLLLNTDLALDSLSADDNKIRPRLNLVREETSRLSRIVDNVQTFARMERGKSETRAITCDVAKVVTELRENFAPLLKRKSISCEFDCRLTGELPIDRDALSQILSNLLSNVEKYAGESSNSRMVISEVSGSLIIEVEDDGPGIPNEAKTRIFLPFERVGSRVDEGTTGTGLGLAISRDLAEQMGGHLELLSASKGAKFRLMLPLTERSTT